VPTLQSGAALVSFQVINPATGIVAGGTARVDSGADITLVDSATIAQIGVLPDGYVEIQGVDGNPVQASTYMVSINLGNLGFVGQARVVGMDGLQSRDGYQMLIGTDLLGTGVFDYFGPTDSFNLQLGVTTGPPISPVPSWVLPVGIVSVGLGLVGLIWGVHG